jgi:hypothetical protein
MGHKHLEGDLFVVFFGKTMKAAFDFLVLVSIQHNG